MPVHVRAYGYKPDKPDPRDHLFAVRCIGQLSKSVDMRSQCPDVYDQLQLGSCTANATAAQMQFDLMKQGKKVFAPSRLFIYYNSRALENTIHHDDGATIRDSIKSVAHWGVPDEVNWPYDISKYALTPLSKVYGEAWHHKVVSYQRVAQDPIALKTALSVGNVINFGFTVYASFESEAVATTGIVPMPTPDEAIVGGHAVLIVGYDDTKQQYIVRNSWGKDWGLEGYFMMPYNYIHSTTLSGDFWVINSVP